MGRAWWGPWQLGDAQVSLIPVARARCARRVRVRDPRQAGQQRQGMLTLTPGQGPGRRRRRAGTRTRAYIKNNNNKNLLALQTAQPAQGDGLAWHFQTSWTCPNSGETRAPSHTRRRSLQRCSTACTPEPPLQEHNSHPPQILPPFKQKYALLPCFSSRGFSPP